MHLVYLLLLLLRNLVSGLHFASPDFNTVFLNQFRMCANILTGADVSLQGVRIKFGQIGTLNYVLLRMDTFAIIFLFCQQMHFFACSHKLDTYIVNSRNFIKI